MAPGSSPSIAAASVLARFSDEQLATVAAFLAALVEDGAAADRPS